ncbi:hypothetical protein T439DRAFT_29122 [Meredithblackwellia eburnea MCA 4105]
MRYGYRSGPLTLRKRLQNLIFQTEWESIKPGYLKILTQRLPGRVQEKPAIEKPQKTAPVPPKPQQVQMSGDTGLVLRTRELLISNAWPIALIESIKTKSLRKAFTFCCPDAAEVASEKISDDCEFEESVSSNILMPTESYMNQCGPQTRFNTSQPYVNDLTGPLQRHRPSLLPADQRTPARCLHRCLQNLYQLKGIQYSRHLQEASRYNQTCCEQVSTAIKLSRINRAIDLCDEPLATHSETPFSRSSINYRLKIPVPGCMSSPYLPNSTLFGPFGEAL